MNQKSLLDAYGLLLFLQKDGPYEVIKTLFRNAQAEGKPVLINEMSVGEIFCVIARTHSVERAESFLPILEVLPLEIVSNTLDDVLRAARIKTQYSIGYGNALVVATAEREKAVLLTGDPEFREVDGVIPIQWLV